MHSCHPQNIDQLICTNQQITSCEAGYWLQCIGNNDGDVGISQSLHQMRVTNAHAGTERTPYANWSGATEPIKG